MTTKRLTWDDECKETLRFYDDGPVALCILWHLLDKLDPNRFGYHPALMGNLRTPLGIGWFLRGLHQFPNITRVVLWGADLVRTGDALLSLWSAGLTKDHRIPLAGHEWTVDPLVDSASIDLLRSSVELVDARGYTFSEIPASLFEDDLRPAIRSQRVTFPPLPIPDRTSLPSRGVFSPIVAKDVGNAWIALLNVVARLGDVRKSRKSENLFHFFHVSAVFPVPETEAIPSFFDVTPADLDRYDVSFLAAEIHEGNEYHYGHRVFRNHGRNQFEELIARFRRSLSTKRGTIVLLEARDIEELEDAPCWAHITFAVDHRAMKLSSSVVFRSHDMYGGWPLNVLTIMRFHRMVRERLSDLGVKLGYMCVVSENAGIYERNLESVLEKVQVHSASLVRKPEFDPDPAGNFIFEILEDKSVAVTMTNFRGDEMLWRESARSPEILVHWVVMRHPWLVPGHVLYLGKEMQKLRAAIDDPTIHYIQD